MGSCTPEEAEARKQVAERRHAREVAQGAAYEEQRIETRWPYVSPSKKVPNTPVKPGQGIDMHKHQNTDMSCGLLCHHKLACAAMANWIDTVAAQLSCA